MLKSIATTRSECAAKQESKASYNADYISPDLNDIFGDDWKEIKTHAEKINIHNCTVKNIALTKNWFVVSNIWEFPKAHTEK